MTRTRTRGSARLIHYYRRIGSGAWRRLNEPLFSSHPIRQDLLDELVWSEVVRLLEDPTLIVAELDRRLAAEPMQQQEQALEHERVRLGKARKRLARFGLTLHPDQSRLIDFCRPSQTVRKKGVFQWERNFDLLGFTHSWGAPGRSAGWATQMVKARFSGALRQIND